MLISSTPAKKSRDRIYLPNIPGAISISKDSPSISNRSGTDVAPDDGETEGELNEVPDGGTGEELEEVGGAGENLWEWDEPLDSWMELLSEGNMIGDFNRVGEEESYEGENLEEDEEHWEMWGERGDDSWMRELDESLEWMRDLDSSQPTYQQDFEDGNDISNTAQDFN